MKSEEELIELYRAARRRQTDWIAPDEIDAYVRGDMSPQEEVEFLDRLSVRPDIARLVAHRMPAVDEATDRGTALDWDGLRAAIHAETGDRLAAEGETFDGHVAIHGRWGPIRGQVVGLWEKLPIRAICYAVGGLGVVSLSVWYAGQPKGSSS